MVTLEELYRRTEEAKLVKKEKFERLQEQNDEELKSYKMDVWKPYEIKGAIVPEFNIPVRKSNNSEHATREMLSKILKFIDYVKRKRINHGCTAMPIPTTSNRNLMIWGSEMGVSRAIQFMIEMGLISVYNDTYHFGSNHKNGNYGKTYAYYKENEDKLIQYCKDNNIEKYVIPSDDDIKTEKQVKKIETINKSKTFDISDVRFGRNLNIEKPEGVSKNEFKQFLRLCLYINYPGFKFYRDKVKEINERFYKDYPEFELRFDIHVTYKKNIVTKIGIRLTNELCSMPKVEREELRKKYGFNLSKDIKSSVPRLTLSLNSGHWVDESVDIYELINEEFEPGSEYTKERRDAIKHYHLISYFEEGSDKLLGKNVTYNINRDGLIKTEVDEMMGRLREAAKKIEGGRFYGSDIFYVESCVYLMTVYDLMTSGHMVWLVYDEFYTDGRPNDKDEDRQLDDETFKEMICRGVKLNFEYFLEHSGFGENHNEVINSYKAEVEKYKKLLV